MSRGAVAPWPVVERCQSIANESSPADLSACLRARRRQSSEIPQRGGRCESTGVIMCYYNGWSSGCVCILERSTDSVVWVLKKAFQKTWPYCRNGHHFYCPALKVLSGGERRVWHCSRQWVVVYYGLWNLEDEHTKKVLFSNIASHFITSAGARCTVQPITPPPAYESLRLHHWSWYWGMQRSHVNPCTFTWLNGDSTHALPSHCSWSRWAPSV